MTDKQINDELTRLKGFRYTEVFNGYFRDGWAWLNSKGKKETPPDFVKLLGREDCLKLLNNPRP